MLFALLATNINIVIATVSKAPCMYYLARCSRHMATSLIYFWPSEVSLAFPVFLTRRELERMDSRAVRRSIYVVSREMRHWRRARRLPTSRQSFLRSSPDNCEVDCRLPEHRRRHYWMHFGVWSHRRRHRICMHHVANRRVCFLFAFAACIRAILWLSAIKPSSAALTEPWFLNSHPTELTE